MLKEFLFTKIEEEDIGNIWFQQNAATCHTTKATLDVLRPVFEDRFISRKADIACIEKPTHPKRVTVWWGFWSRGIIGPFFFKNEQGKVFKM